jgi:hypothetical protein
MKKARKRDDSPIGCDLLPTLPQYAGLLAATARGTPARSFYACHQPVLVIPGFAFAAFPRFLFTCLAPFQAFIAVLENLNLPMKKPEDDPGRLNPFIHPGPRCHPHPSSSK